MLETAQRSHQTARWTETEFVQNLGLIPNLWSFRWGNGVYRILSPMPWRIQGSVKHRVNMSCQPLLHPTCDQGEHRKHAGGTVGKTRLNSACASPSRFCSTVIRVKIPVPHQRFRQKLPGVAFLGTHIRRLIPCDGLGGQIDPGGAEDLRNDGGLDLNLWIGIPVYHEENSMRHISVPFRIAASVGLTLGQTPAVHHQI